MTKLDVVVIELYALTKTMVMMQVRGPSPVARVRVTCFVLTRIHKWVLYGSVVEGGGSGTASGLRLEGRLCSMPTVILGENLVVAFWV